MVFEVLRTGKENAIPSGYLRQILKFKSVRELQKQIQAERLQGKVILSSSQAPGGYYLPACKSEAKEFIITLENRAGATLEAIQSAKEYLKQLDDEQGGFDYGQSNERNINSDPAEGRP
ncbi:MAG: hypothetical protein HFI13_10985 [Lachnospiraceae bacterium]|nr:hypothetical protein [Lachnospiraceae bacterium]